MKKLLPVFISVLMLSFNIAYSQPVNMFAKKGQWEIGGTISFSSTTYVYHDNSDYTWSVFRFAPNAACFLTDGFELGGMLDLQSSKGEGASQTQYTFYAVPSYNFGTNSYTYPYIQAQLGYTGLSDRGSGGFAWAIEGGMKMNFITHGLIKLGINYNQVTYDNSGSSREGLNTISAVIGVGLFF